MVIFCTSFYHFFAAFFAFLFPILFFFITLRSLLFALSSSYFVLSPAGADLGQTLCYWTVPAPGALFVTGSRFWTIVGLSQDRAGKVLALRE
jgi:hypothetical protein